MDYNKYMTNHAQYEDYCDGALPENVMPSG